jgi:hypothetical protein
LDVSSTGRVRGQALLPIVLKRGLRSYFHAK